MDASKKQREPVAFKSLAELKRFIRPGVEFKTVSQTNHADMVGLTRVVTTVQTVGFYSKIKDQPEHPFSTCNHGKGFYTDFGKAGNYIFDGTTVKVKDARKQNRGVIYELEFYDREQNMEETMMDRKMVNFIKEQYPPGTRIRLNSMEDPYAPILPGTEGEVDYVDDAGQLHMKWDNGRSLALIPGEDSFSVLPPKLTSLKLYMPLTADLYERNEYGDFDDSSTLLEGRELRGYQDQITAALVKNRMPEEAERGLMHWYDEADSVDRKVRSAVFAVEERNRQLWGVAECRVAGELSDTELEALKEYLTGQASDGWGEGFEQREISVDDGGELYVHFWNSDEWCIQTEQELFSPKLADGLPELCFSTLPGTGELICIKRGESGYYPSEWSTNDPAHNREIRSRFRFPSRRLGMQDFWARICTSRSLTVLWSLPRIRMMSKDHEYLYPYSAQEAKKRNQLPMWRESYHANVACRNAIEETIRQNFDGMHLKKDCLEPVLAEYGYKRTEWVLATTLQELSWDGRFSRANKQWAARRYIPQDGRHNAEITVRSHPAILDGFVDLYREAYQKLGLFGPEHCVGDRAEQDYIGKVLVLSPDTLKESCWSQENQLWYAHDGFGCSPHAIGRSVRCTCLSDGEMTRWNRDEFVGVLDEKFLPDWAKESLSQFQQEEAAESPSMNNQSM